tara:strand:- start:559 stop:954 length:396 start_codon:yes stop_codon:yes gene_type:complete
MKKSYNFLFLLTLTYSKWAIILHLLFILGLIPNTYSIAIVVAFIGSFLVLYNDYSSSYYRNKDLLLLSANLVHFLPLLLFLYYPMIWNWSVLIISIVVYLIYLTVIGINPIHMYFNIFDYLPEQLKNNKLF